MTKSHRFSSMLVPLFAFVLLAFLLLVQRRGVGYQIPLSYGNLKLLPQANVDVAGFFPDKPVDALVLYDSLDVSTEDFVENVLATLDSMRVKYDTLDTATNFSPDFTKYSTVIVAFMSLEEYKPQVLALMDWVEAGGRVFFSVRPVPSGTFSIIHHKLGIISKIDSLINANGVEYRTDLLPGGKGMSFQAENLNHASFRVQLSEEARVHLTSADGNNIPLLWEYDLGEGRVVFVNTYVFGRKDGRGVLGAGYGLLQDVLAYPVINSSVFFIDDFPSPVPSGSMEIIEQEYGMRIGDFYANVWWPDILNLSDQYHIKYTGVLIETYDDSVAAPFSKQWDSEGHRYYGRSILANEGEIGLHGYNHVPLCLLQTGVNPMHGYPGWPTGEGMQLSIYELLRFSKSLFPENTFSTYVPPSNILCPDARLWLPAVLPDLKVIAGVYVNDSLKTAYEQEFTEASDGIIELPRIISGYDPAAVARYAAINELGLHYVNSHFVHPDDILDPERGALKGWEYLRGRFEEYVRQLSESAPGLRSMTAGEGAIAVQRFARLAVQTENRNGALEITLGNYYDEAWLMLRTIHPPVSIEGGTILPVTSNLFLIQALTSKVTIRF